jgi:hypothetical protein
MTSHDLRYYSTILTELEKLDVPYCIVGGHAVGIWAERFLDSSQVEGGFPLLSKEDVFKREVPANAQGERNDFLHLRLLAQVIPLYLEDLKEKQIPELDLGKESDRLALWLNQKNAGKLDQMVNRWRDDVSKAGG